MGYRSEGKMWLSPEALFVMPEDCKEHLSNWEREEVDYGVVFSFSYWNWYEGYEEVTCWINFFNFLKEENMEEHFDFCRIGEDYDDIESLTGERFHVSRVIQEY